LYASSSLFPSRAATPIDRLVPLFPVRPDIDALATAIGVGCVGAMAGSIAAPRRTVTQALHWMTKPRS
jgi:hypothetical protein